ncbi:hypothetical protein Tco_1227602 [Tanacetum coccineum]
MNYVPVTVGTISKDLQVEDGPNNENAKQERFADDSSNQTDVNADGQHVNTASPDVISGRTLNYVVGPTQLILLIHNEQDST